MLSNFLKSCGFSTNGNTFGNVGFPKGFQEKLIFFLQTKLSLLVLTLSPRTKT